MLGVLIAGACAFHAQAGDEYEPESIVQCGFENRYGTSPRLEVVLNAFEHLGTNAVLMSHTTFESRGVSVSAGCRVTEVKVENEFVVLFNTLQGCRARIGYTDPRSISATVDAGGVFSNCVAPKKEELLKSISEFDPSIKISLQ